jgi:hypothetical protein
MSCRNRFVAPAIPASSRRCCFPDSLESTISDFSLTAFSTAADTTRTIRELRVWHATILTTNCKKRRLITIQSALPVIVQNRRKLKLSGVQPPLARLGPATVLRVICPRLNLPECTRTSPITGFESLSPTNPLPVKGGGLRFGLWALGFGLRTLGSGVPAFFFERLAWPQTPKVLANFSPGLRSGNPGIEMSDLLWSETLKEFRFARATLSGLQ